MEFLVTPFMEHHMLTRLLHFIALQILNNSDENKIRFVLK